MPHAWGFIPIPAYRMRLLPWNKPPRRGFCPARVEVKRLEPFRWLFPHLCLPFPPRGTPPHVTSRARARAAAGNAELLHACSIQTQPTYLLLLQVGSVQKQLAGSPMAGCAAHASHHSGGELGRRLVRRSTPSLVTTTVCSN